MKKTRRDAVNLNMSKDEVRKRYEKLSKMFKFKLKLEWKKDGWGEDEGASE